MYTHLDRADGQLFLLRPECSEILFFPALGMSLSEVTLWQRLELELNLELEHLN
jgi:hypothetical protein